LILLDSVFRVQFVTCGRPTGAMNATWSLGAEVSEFWRSLSLASRKFTRDPSALFKSFLNENVEISIRLQYTYV
jgi:hypothetical protein